MLVETIERSLDRSLAVHRAVAERDLEGAPGVDDERAAVTGDIPVVCPQRQVGPGKVEERGPPVIVEIETETRAELESELCCFGRVRITKAPGVDLELGDCALTPIEHIEVFEEKPFFEIHLAAEAVFVPIHVLPQVCAADGAAPVLRCEWCSGCDADDHHEKETLCSRHEGPLRRTVMRRNPGVTIGGVRGVLRLRK